MIDFDEAVALVVALARPLESEPVGLAQAWDRVLAEPVVARADAPVTAVSAMDGYAVRDDDLLRPPVSLSVRDTLFAGRAAPAPLGHGGCARIFTGAPVPEGADRVVVQESVRREGGIAVFETPPGAARNIRAGGSDFRAGDELLGVGARLTPQALIAAAAADVATVRAVRRPRVVVLGTGDELAEPGQAHLTAGAVPDSVSFGVMGLARAYGAELLGRRRLADAPEDLKMAAAETLAEADVVVVTGGASVGEKDLAKAMFETAGLELVFSRVAIKPGKPVWLGRAGGRLIVGLPGNPTSALVTARLFLAPLLAGLGGRDPAAALAWREAPLAEPLAGTGERETFHRGLWRHGAAVPLGNQDSGAQKALAAAELLIRRRPGDPAAAVRTPVTILDF